MYCIYCGAELPEIAEFCFMCGNKVYRNNNSNVLKITDACTCAETVSEIINSTSSHINSFSRPYSDVKAAHANNEKKSHASKENFCIEGDTLVKCKDCSGAIEIPRGIKKIKALAFDSCRYLTSIIIPEGVTEIGENAFTRCSNLSDVSLPSSLLIIGESAFAYSGLTNIVIPDNVSEIGSIAFKGCEKLRSVVLPAGLRKIDGLFIYCNNLTDVVIPDGVTEIGSNSFRGCKNLKQLAIPSSVTKIGEGAFENTCLTSIVIPSSVTDIEEDVFFGSNIQEIQAEKKILNILFPHKIYEYLSPFINSHAKTEQSANQLVMFIRQKVTTNWEPKYWNVDHNRITYYEEWFACSFFDDGGEDEGKYSWSITKLEHYNKNSKVVDSSDLFKIENLHKGTIDERFICKNPFGMNGFFEFRFLNV